MPRPSPVILVSIIISILLAMLAVTWGWLRSGGTSGKPTGEPLPEPLSYVKPTPGGQFELAVFGSPEAEAKLTGEAKQKSALVRSRYPRPGLYARDQPAQPLWEINGYAPDENVFLTTDGECLIRLEGDWWKTKAYPAGKRLATEVEQAQLEAPAVSFFRKGQLLRQYPLNALVTQPDKLTHSPDHILWPGGAVLNEADGRFILFTQDSNRIIFDVRTGEIVSQAPVGLGSRFAQWVVSGIVALMAITVLIWAYFALIRKKKPA